MSSQARVAILTRAAEDNVELAERLRARGTRVIEVPCVRVEHLRDTSALAEAVAKLGREDWLVVTSRAGADAIGTLPRPLARVAAIGVATAERLRSRGVRVSFTPSVASGERLARELPSAELALLARSDRAMPDLPRILRERGFAVREVIAYRTVAMADGDIAGARRALDLGDGPVDIFVSSPSALDGLVAVLDPALVARARLVVSGETTYAAARARLGLGAEVALMEEGTHVAHR
jgi:uroporphyrinogen-III synthase